MINLYCVACDTHVTTMPKDEAEFLTVTCEECW
jgi:hypothetical protein